VRREALLAAQTITPQAVYTHRNAADELVASKIYCVTCYYIAFYRSSVYSVLSAYLMCAGSSTVSVVVLILLCTASSESAAAAGATSAASDLYSFRTLTAASNCTAKQRIRAAVQCTFIVRMLECPHWLYFHYC
jgi:hypothetical protein